MNAHDVSRIIEETLGLGGPTQTRIFLSLAVILSLWLVRRVLLRTVHGHTGSVHARYRWRKTTGYVAFVVGFLVVGRIWFHGFASLSTMVGLMSAGVAIALKDPLVNLAGWLFIMWRHPFTVGDRIQVDKDVAGDVIDLRIFSFSLMEIGNWVDADQSTGRVIHVPNGVVFSKTVANFSKGFRYIWDEMSVLVTFESNWRKAKKILEDIVSERSMYLTESAEDRLREASKQFMIFYKHLTPIVYTSVKDCGVMLSIRFLVAPQERRGRREAMWEDILDAFARHDDIDFAYPTQRMYFNAREGKTGTRPPKAGLAPPPHPNHGYVEEEFPV